MFKLLDKFSEDLIVAQKSKDEVSTSTLRLLISDIKNSRIAKGADLTDDEIFGEIVKSAKKRKESIDAFKAANRADLVEKESAELRVLEKYLPVQMTEVEILRVVDSVISKLTGAESGDFGKIIGTVMSEVKDKADGKLVSEIVKKRLEAK